MASSAGKVLGLATRMLAALVFLCPAAGAADLEELMRGMADSRGVVADFREVKEIAVVEM